MASDYVDGMVEWLNSVPVDCASCGKPAEGFAMVGDERYCHPDEGPSCYEGARR